MELWQHFFLQQNNKIFFYKSIILYCCGYLGAAPIPYVQDAIFNLPNPYVRSTTVLHNTKNKLCRLQDAQREREREREREGEGERESGYNSTESGKVLQTLGIQLGLYTFCIK